MDQTSFCGVPLHGVVGGIYDDGILNSHAKVELASLAQCKCHFILTTFVI